MANYIKYKDYIGRKITYYLCINYIRYMYTIYTYTYMYTYMYTCIYIYASTYIYI